MQGSSLNFKFKEMESSIIYLITHKYEITSLNYYYRVILDKRRPVYLRVSLHLHGARSRIQLFNGIVRIGNKCFFMILNVALEKG